MTHRLLLFVCLVIGAAAVVPPPSGPPATLSVRTWGVNVHWGGAGRSGELDQVCDAFAMVRTDLRWEQVETSPGTFNFSVPDTLVEALSARGMTPYLILDGHSPLYKDVQAWGNAGSEARAAFVRFAVAAMLHYRGRGVIFELWNEPNKWKQQVLPSDLTAGWYVDLCSRLAAAKNASAPLRGETLVGPALAAWVGGWLGPIDTRFLKYILGKGALRGFDGISVHAYSYAEPETRLAAFASARALMDQHGMRAAALVSGEWGWSTCRGASGSAEVCWGGAASG
eukprot:Hpha_TRINITY_DN10326_c0_g2::TRINITY_DN10326_c0_g2_i1::g.116058::m.116058